MGEHSSSLLTRKHYRHQKSTIKRRIKQSIVLATFSFSLPNWRNYNIDPKKSI